MAPLKGELSAKLTDGFRLGFQHSLAKKRKRVFCLWKRLFVPKSQPLSLGFAEPAPLSGELF